MQYADDCSTATITKQSTRAFKYTSIHEEFAIENDIFNVKRHSVHVHVCL